MALYIELDQNNVIKAELISEGIPGAAFDKNGNQVVPSHMLDVTGRGTSGTFIGKTYDRKQDLFIDPVPVVKSANEIVVDDLRAKDPAKWTTEDIAIWLKLKT